MKQLADCGAAQVDFLNWAMREFLVLWCSQVLMSEDNVFDLDTVPDRFTDNPGFAALVHEYAKSKSFVSKRNDRQLTSKAWKAATSQLKKG